MTAETPSTTRTRRSWPSSATSRSSSRTWSGFSNFAISFSIISILAGCFTTFGQAWNNGGPIAISWGWPIISAFILLIGFTMCELVSAYPTSGGIYWWAAKMGGPAAGFFTGWLNLIGLLAVTASVAYGCATFLDLTISTISAGWADELLPQPGLHPLRGRSCAVASLVNIFSGHLMAVINNISVWWHVAGAAIVDRWFWSIVPTTTRASASCSPSGSTTPATRRLSSGSLLVPGAAAGVPAHPVHDHRLRRLGPPLGGDRRAAADGAAKGIWRSIFYSAIGG